MILTTSNEPYNSVPVELTPESADAQGFSHVPGGDYATRSTYAPVTQLASIRIVLALANCLDYQIHQVDINLTKGARILMATLPTTKSSTRAYLPVILSLSSIAVFSTCVIPASVMTPIVQFKTNLLE